MTAADAAVTTWWQTMLEWFGADAALSSGELGERLRVEAVLCF